MAITLAAGLVPAGERASRRGRRAAEQQAGTIRAPGGRHARLVVPDARQFVPHRDALRMCDTGYPADPPSATRPSRPKGDRVGRRFAGVASAWVPVACVLVAVVLAGCSELGGRRKDAAPEPNVLPTDYRDQLLIFLKTYLGSAAGIIRDASISEPALKPFGSESRYVVCVRYNDGDGNHEKMAVYFSGSINQFIDPTAAQCSGTAYQPFPELLALGAKAGTPRK
jgi:hypothetical protein